MNTDSSRTPGGDAPDVSQPTQRTSNGTQLGQAAQLRADILTHLEEVGLGADASTKEGVRKAHHLQRIQYRNRVLPQLLVKKHRLLAQFATGREVVPASIDPIIQSVESGTEDADLFRMATLMWSVPVSPGYGRRMRFIVRDRSNGKLIGILALGDPVFNLSSRDRWIGWSADERKRRLVNVMDAYVAGAVPPYSLLLGGKLVVALMGSAEVAQYFKHRYRDSVGIISGEAKRATLALITVTSALGRSALYNRVRLRDPECGKLIVDLQRIGQTKGFGHFHLSDDHFGRLRELLAAEGHPYANGHRYGTGPNWRMRVVRVGLDRLGLSPTVQRHGISREVFALPLGATALPYLRGEGPWVEPRRPEAAVITQAAMNRWILPRASRRSDFRTFGRSDLEALLGID